MSGAFGLGRFSVSGADTSGGLPRELLESVSAEEDLHKGLIGMGVPDVTPPMFKSRGSISGSNADMATELARVQMDWANLLFALSFFPPEGGASWSMSLVAGKAPVGSRRSEFMLGRSF
ncbi:hypothetical protein B296_00041317 [Ensete ventricosum]|uniref:Uncharacterized protein n=1 Tax=Ensete ventricosum TaxID=4639 RepID=A0A426Z1V1_ENSVE|nr:hypothetical protein B296_00041317 [Ensete ventricosum]